MDTMVKVLFVCMGNICRSPSAHGVFLDLLAQHQLSNLVEVDSAGTHAYHVGEPPDPRSQVFAQKRGFDLSALRARRVDPEDYFIYDYILAMDQANMDILIRECPREHMEKVQLFLTYAPEVSETEVPDPYYGGERGFDHVLDLVEAASQGLLEHIRQHHLAGSTVQ
ncbi:MAG: low molecular weight phosphotyrosine protein phosphatase [Vampirovibrio sp.]|nr:low molecular weight phosphotyrosine protein phosphatase [Vampirovibrio sp.]